MGERVGEGMQESLDTAFNCAQFWLLHFRKNLKDFKAAEKMIYEKFLINVQSQGLLFLAKRWPRNVKIGILQE